LESLRPYSPPPIPTYDVLYYYGDELPKTQDTGGAQSGKTGLAGGSEAHHRTQTIRVARGDRKTDTVVDAPKLDLPRSDSAVANLMAFKPLPSAPPAEGMRSKLTAPVLPDSVVPPTPELNARLTRSNNLTNTPVAPAPDLSRASTRNLPNVNSSVVAPAPDISRDKLRATNSLTQSVVAPAPKDAPRDLASSRADLTQTTSVVAPPVSAPQRDITSSSRLTLPAPAVVAPPPSQVSRDLNSWGSLASGNVNPTPVPPPPSASGGSFSGRKGADLAAPQVVPPAVSADRGGGGQSGRRTAALGSADVVPPPPSIGGGKALSGSGTGNQGQGRGSPLDLGSAVAPPANSGGNTPGSGVVISSQPGTKVGVPNAGSGGSIAMSPAGTSKTGVGGSGGGTGIGKGPGSGSGLQGEGPGGGKEGVGRGSDPNARGGISPYPGGGGAGNGASGAPAVPGVSVQGGNTITLPSFGVAGGDVPAGPGRTSTTDHKGAGVTVVATSRSGGVFNRYGQLKGDRVYSIYLDTSIGTAVMQFADSASAAHPYLQDLTAPEAIRQDLPQGLRPTHVVIACILDSSGSLKDLKVLEPGAAEATSKILAALPNWKFRPAFRGNEPVEVNAIIGFGVDTR
jgi:hypothetical protein